MKFFSRFSSVSVQQRFPCLFSLELSRETTIMFLAKASHLSRIFSFLFRFFFDTFPPVPVPTILKQNLLTPPTGVTGEGSFRQFRHPKKHEVKRQFRPRLLFSPSARGTGPRPDHPYKRKFYFFSCRTFIPDPDTPKNIKRYADSACSFCPHLAPPALSKNRFRCSSSFYNLHPPLEAYPSFILFNIGIECRFRLYLFFSSPPPFLASLSQTNASFRTLILLLLYHPPVERAPVPTILKKFLFIFGPDSDTQRI
jgi:hypothetical protein